MGAHLLRLPKLTKLCACHEVGTSGFIKRCAYHENCTFIKIHIAQPCVGASAWKVEIKMLR